eukprot:UN01875
MPNINDMVSLENTSETSNLNSTTQDRDTSESFQILEQNKIQIREIKDQTRDILERIRELALRSRLEVRRNDETDMAIRDARRNLSRAEKELRNLTKRGNLPPVTRQQYRA